LPASIVEAIQGKLQTEKYQIQKFKAFVFDIFHAYIEHLRHQTFKF